jgi:hypothetical protein
MMTQSTLTVGGVAGVNNTGSLLQATGASSHRDGHRPTTLTFAPSAATRSRPILLLWAFPRRDTRQRQAAVFGLAAAFAFAFAEGPTDPPRCARHPNRIRLYGPDTRAGARLRHPVIFFSGY